MGVTFHTSSNPRANLLSLPSALTAPHTGRAGRMLLAPASKFSRPDPASGPAGGAGGAGALAGRAGDSASPAPALGMLQGSSPWLLWSPQRKTAVLGNFWGLPAAQHFPGLQLLTAWQGHGQCQLGMEFIPRYFREHLPNIGVHTHRAPVELPVPGTIQNPVAGHRVMPGQGGTQSRQCSAASSGENCPSGGQGVFCQPGHRPRAPG